MRAEVREQLVHWRTQATEQLGSGESQWLCIPTSSFRKRMEVALKLWISNELAAQYRPPILDDPQAQELGIEWEAFVRCADPLEIIRVLHRIPNGNGVANSAHDLGTWRGFRVLAIPNGGEQHLPTSTPQSEAVSKAVFDAAELHDLFGPGVYVLGMDGNDFAGRVKRDAVVQQHAPRMFFDARDVQSQARQMTWQQAAHTTLGKPRGKFKNPLVEQGTEAFSREYHDYILANNLLGSVELVNAVAMALLEVHEALTDVREVCATVRLTTTYLSYVTEVTDELAAQLLTTADADTAGFQFFQRVAVQQGIWEQLVDTIAQVYRTPLAAPAIESEKPEVSLQMWEQTKHFLALAHILGTNIFPILRCIEQLPVQQVAVRVGE